MLRINKERLIAKAVMGQISHPRMPLKNPYIVSSSGDALVLPGTGGITYNVLVGDSVFNFEGDHFEPCVSITSEDRSADNSLQGALNILSCIGNEAVVVSGSASGSKGVVTGKHGGVEHVLCDFPQPVISRLAIGDRVQIKGWGQGLKLKDFPQVHVMNISPELFQKIGIGKQGDQLIVPVTHVIPASIMGSGYGSRHSYSGDIDIQLTDKESIQKNRLQELRIGDIIAIRDLDCRLGRVIRGNAMSIGVIVHGACLVSGHGPGVTIIMSTSEKVMVPKIDESANIGRVLRIGRWRRKSSYNRRRR